MDEEELQQALTTTEQRFNELVVEMERLRGDYRTYKALLDKLQTPPQAEVITEGEADAPDKAQPK